MKAFISHSSADKALARRIADDISLRDGEVWLDERDLAVGKPLAAALETALADIDVFVVLLTESSVTSRWVRFELDHAMSLVVERGVRILPLKAGAAEIPAVLTGYLYADLSKEGALTRALNLSFLSAELELPLSGDAVRARYEGRHVPELCVRVVRTRDLGHSSMLGAPDRKYVSVADYFEQCGRPLREILENLYVGSTLDHYIDPADEFSAVVFEAGRLYAKKLDLLPGTWRAVYRALSDHRRLALFAASNDAELDADGSVGDYWAGDQRRWNQRVRAELEGAGYSSHRDEQVLYELFGIQSMCFVGDGLGPVDSSAGRGPAACRSRVFFVKNLHTSAVQHWRVDLGRPNDGRILP